MRFFIFHPSAFILCDAPVAQGIERLPPEQKVARSNRAGRSFRGMKAEE